MLSYFDSPIGLLKITASERGIRSVKRISKEDREKLPKHDSSTESGHALNCRQQLAEYFDRKRTDFDLKFDWMGHGEFQQSVWAELLKIPFGHTTSYGAIAAKIGDKNASRAVGMANRNNPIAIIVPCHRVIAKSGELQGYFYGLDTKRFLLQLENPKSFAIQGGLF